ncbi:N-acetylneuraminate synthase family protein [Halosimplex halophilum]|uniref:N-acetylneuraminate synthase family protein n=1 Tax=Halosimplex halophilum TaxID=2559572 RepID=UPI00143547D4|nr:N-acetylneuraminate synthase family protein [Halosimplex halophilum]
MIAEVGGNHGGDIETAIKYIHAAADAGAHAVKFQLYSAETLIVEDEPPLPLAGDEYDSQYERFKELEFTLEEWEQLVNEAETAGIDFAGSVFNERWADFVASRSPFVKIASGDLTNIPLLRYVKDLEVPVVLSTGFASMAEIERAVTEIPNDRLHLLHCVGAYPTDQTDANLQMLDRLSDAFDVPIGYSDHTVGPDVVCAAMSRGATIIEKHFTLNKSKKVGDHRLSANPEEMSEIVKHAEWIDSIRGNEDRIKGPLDAEDDLRHQMRRSLAVDNGIADGERFKRENLIALRPESGLDPKMIDDVIGKCATRDITAKTILTESDIQGL